MNDELLNSILSPADDAGRYEAAVRELGISNDSASDLVEVASEWMHRNPVRARQLVAIAMAFGQELGADLIIARAQYLTAVGAGIMGDFEQALDAAERAGSRFEQLGASVDATRSIVGRSGFLAAAGRGAEAEELLTDLLQSFDDTVAQDSQLTLVRALARQNLGTILIGRGALESGIENLDTAAGAFRELDESQRLIHVAANRSPALVALGRGSEAITTLQRLLDRFDVGAEPHAMGVLLEELGRAMTTSGELALALSAYEGSVEAFEAAEMPVEARRCELRLAQLLVDLYLVQEAEELFERVEAALRVDPHPHHWAILRHGRGLAEHDLGRYDEARHLLEGAAEAFLTLGLELDAAQCNLDLIETLRRSGHRAQARGVAEATISLIPEGSWPVVRFLATLQLARLAEDTSPSEGDIELSASASAFGTHLPPPLKFLFDQHRAERARAAGLDDQAIGYLEQAIEQIESTRSSLTHDRYRRAFLASRLSTYEDLFALLVERGDAESVHRAFEVVEQARSRSLLDILSSSISTMVGDGEELAEIRDLRRDLDALYNQLLDDDGSSRGLRLSVQTERARALEDQLSLAMDKAGVRVAARGVGTPSTDEMVAGARRQDTTIVSFHLHEGSIFAFVAGPDDIELVRLEASAANVERTVRRARAQMERFRMGSDFISRWADELQSLAKGVLTDLYQALWAPISGHLGPNTSRVLVIPAGFLCDVPFAALCDGDEYLLERYEFSISPSAAAWLAAGGSESPRPLGVIVAAQDEGLPHTEREARETAVQLGSIGLSIERLTGVEQLAEHHRPSILHLACHGVFRSDNPMFSALKLGDSWLTTAEIATLDLRGTVVVLSACESGRVAWVRGEEIAGLARAFLASGARAVVGSNWLVDDSNTADLMQVIYSMLCRGVDLGASLRAAQLGALEHHAHPFSWAAFTVLGASHFALAPSGSDAPPADTFRANDTQPLKIAEVR